MPGVLVGFSTLLSDAAGRQVRTGVTAILPRGRDPVPRPVWAGFHALNGNGEMTGVHWVSDGGYFVGPVCLTNTHSVGTVHQAAVRWTVETYRDAWTREPPLGDARRGRDLRRRAQRHQRVPRQGGARVAALGSAGRGPVAEGNVGGGTGMICYDFEGGTGTASRVVQVADRRGHLAALVQANHGVREWLTVLGVPVGRHLTADRLFDGAERGSIIVVLAAAEDTPTFRPAGKTCRAIPRDALARLVRRTAGNGGLTHGSDLKAP